MKMSRFIGFSNGFLKRRWTIASFRARGTPPSLIQRSIRHYTGPTIYRLPCGGNQPEKGHWFKANVTEQMWPWWPCSLHGTNKLKLFRDNEARLPVTQLHKLIQATLYYRCWIYTSQWLCRLSLSRTHQVILIRTSVCLSYSHKITEDYTMYLFGRENMHKTWRFAVQAISHVMLTNPEMN